MLLIKQLLSELLSVLCKGSPHCNTIIYQKTEEKDRGKDKEKLNSFHSHEVFLLQIVNSISVWLKRLAVKGSYAIAFLNEDDQGRAMPFDIHLGDIGLTSANGYNVTDVFDNVHRGQFKPASVLSVLIDPTSIVILKAVPL